MTQPLSRSPVHIHDIVSDWAAATPSAPALSDAHGALDYAGLEHASADVARALADAGVRPGDRLLVVGENCVAACVAVLAASRLRAWSCMVNARLSAREVDNFIAHAGARRVLYTGLASRDALAHAERHGAQPWPELAGTQLGPLAPAVQPEPVSPDPARQVAALIYTSGTSGAPKGVMLSHASILFAADTTRRLRGFRPDDRLYGALPMAHVVGLSNQFLGTMASGASLHLVARFEPQAMAQALAAGEVTGFFGVPAMYARLLAWSRDTGQRLAAPALRYMGTAGAPLTPALKADAERAFGIVLHNGYGMTEMAPTIAQTRMDAPRADRSVGHAIPGVETRLLGRDGAPVADGEVGELWVRGPNRMLGYYRDEALTRAVVDEQGWLNTGDLAHRGADGALHIVGRTKELIIRSGFNVYPVEVEQVLNAHPQVVQSAVVGRAVEGNEEVVAFVEAMAGEPPSEAALRRYLREHLSPYKVPSEIRFVPCLPAAPSGKILKNQLKQLAAERVQ
ncbi:acyl--CoA ligase [Verticiella sediminum]|uniref:Acyl--CoA ligase n=1 Tax=Verticiella sediminum TaxID=1247510 RepID=A0A556AB19_9BURK|nr:class I adenylate-forming enzyme family protein [Verticiella sediminum]TSH90080.1 acyl--CoA ligase [Verticiella sediminum]